MMETPSDHNMAERQDRAWTEFEEFFSSYRDKYVGEMYVYEFQMWLYYIVWRLRQTLKQDETRSLLGGTLQLVETAIARSREGGNDVLIAEDWRDMEGGREMIEALNAFANDDDFNIG